MKNKKAIVCFLLIILFGFFIAIIYYECLYEPYLPPEKVLISFYKAAKNKEYSKCSKYIASKIIKDIGQQEFCDKSLEYIERIEIPSGKGTFITGESATVQFNFVLNEAGIKRFGKPSYINFKKNKKGKETYYLSDDERGLASGEIKMLMENGRWKLNGYHKTFNVTYK
jgi:hypothetical protein